MKGCHLLCHLLCIFEVDMAPSTDEHPGNVGARPLSRDMEGICCVLLIWLSGGNQRPQWSQQQTNCHREHRRCAAVKNTPTPEASWLTSAAIEGLLHFPPRAPRTYPAA
jgi:hypothetical protein